MAKDFIQKAIKKPGALAKTGAATTRDVVDTKEVSKDLLVIIPVSPRIISFSLYDIFITRYRKK